jgi:hypothetical protein
MFRKRAEYWFAVRYKQALAVNPGKLICDSQVAAPGIVRKKRKREVASTQRLTPVVLTRGGRAICGVAKDARSQRIIRTIILATHPIVYLGLRIKPKLIDPMINNVAAAALPTGDGIVIAAIATIAFILAAPRPTLSASWPNGLSAAGGKRVCRNTLIP